MFGSSSRQLPHSYPAGPNKHGSYRTSANEEVSENARDAASTPRRSSTSVTTENHGVGGSTPPLAILKSAACVGDASSTAGARERIGSKGLRGAQKGVPHAGATWGHRAPSPGRPHQT